MPSSRFRPARPATAQRAPLLTPSPRAQWRLLGCALALCAFIGLSPAQAQDAPYAEVHRLLNAGQLPEALQTADTWLKEQPKDPQMRFLKGVIQSQQGQSDTAMQTFTLITQDYPELPEPYNNLAALHASAKRYDQARAALEMAVQLNPGYATAHQNLGDVYTQLAAQAYAQAIQLNPENAALRPKLKGVQAVLANNPAAKVGTPGLPPSATGW